MMRTTDVMNRSLDADDNLRTLFTTESSIEINNRTLPDIKPAMLIEEP